MNKYEKFPALNDYEVTDDSHARIVNAAIYLFSQQGYLQTSTKAIAQLANVSEALIFKRFKSKSALLEVVFIEIIQERLPKVLLYGMDQLKTGTLSIQHPEDISKFLTYKFKYILNHIGYFKILFQELQFNEAEALEKIRDMFKQLVQELDKIIAALQMKGIVRSDLQPKLLFRSLAGSLNFLLLDYQILGSEIDLDSEIPQVIQLFLEGAAYEKQA